MKALIKKILFNPRVAKKIVKLLLRLHTFSYNLLGPFAIAAEGGIHPKHRLTNYHKFFVDNINESDTVLDIGCGNGALTYDIAKKAKYVYAIDISKNNINEAKKKFSAPNITYLVGDATSFNFNQKFDVIVLSNVLEHIENRVEFLKRISTLSNKFLIRVPMLNRDWVVLYKKELGLSYKSDSSHYIEYTSDLISQELLIVDLKIQKSLVLFGEFLIVATKN